MAQAAGSSVGVPVPKEDPRLGRLLSGRNEPSVLETEDVLEAVLARVEANQADSSPLLARASEGALRPGMIPNRPRRRAWPVASMVLAAAAVFALWIRSPEPRDDEFQARGPGGELATLVVHCMSGSPESEHCVPGATLAFELSSPASQQYFALFLVHPTGNVTWYFPDATGKTPSLAGMAPGAPWSETARLAPDIVGGTYELIGLFSERALTRAELKATLGDNLRSTHELTVTRRKLVVERVGPTP